MSTGARSKCTPLSPYSSQHGTSSCIIYTRVAIDWSDTMLHTRCQYYLVLRVSRVLLFTTNELFLFKAKVKFMRRRVAGSQCVSLCVCVCVCVCACVCMCVAATEFVVRQNSFLSKLQHKQAWLPVQHCQLHLVCTSKPAHSTHIIGLVQMLFQQRDPSSTQAGPQGLGAPPPDPQILIDPPTSNLAQSGAECTFYAREVRHLGSDRSRSPALTLCSPEQLFWFQTKLLCFFEKGQSLKQGFSSDTKGRSVWNQTQPQVIVANPRVGGCSRSEEGRAPVSGGSRCKGNLTVDLDLSSISEYGQERF